MSQGTGDGPGAELPEATLKVTLQPGLPRGPKLDAGLAVCASPPATAGTRSHLRCRRISEAESPPHSPLHQRGACQGKAHCVGETSPSPAPGALVKMGACLAPEAAGFQLWLFDGCVRKTLCFLRSVKGAREMTHGKQRCWQLKGKGQLALQGHETGL